MIAMVTKRTQEAPAPFTRLQTRDEYLRDYGWKIQSRPATGEPTWVLVAEEHAALLICSLIRQEQLKRLEQAQKEENNSK